MQVSETLPFLLIVKQPDLGSALVFMPTLFIMLLAAGAKLRHILSLVGMGFVLLSTGRYLEAVAPLTVAVQIAPDFLDAMAYLGLSQARATW